MQIIIKDPCSENWNAMTPNEKGRFCDACEKTVVDFSKMTDLEIYHALHNHKGKICGRMSVRQIENFNLAHQEFPSPSNLKKWSLAAMLAGFLAYPSMSQPEVNFQNSLAAVMPMFNNNLDQEIAVNESVNTPVDTVVFAGKVINTLKNPVAGATILIQGTSIIAKADSNGVFRISVPKPKTELSITVSADGHQTAFIIAPLESKLDFVIELFLAVEEPMIMGGLTVEMVEKHMVPTKREKIKKNKKNK